MFTLQCQLCKTQKDLPIFWHEIFRINVTMGFANTYLFRFLITALTTLRVHIPKSVFGISILKILKPKYSRTWKIQRIMLTFRLWFLAHFGGHMDMGAKRAPKGLGLHNPTKIMAQWMEIFDQLLCWNCVLKLSALRPGPPLTQNKPFMPE